MLLSQQHRVLNLSSLQAVLEVLRRVVLSFTNPSRIYNPPLNHPPTAPTATMHRLSIYLLAAWATLAATTASPEMAGQSEFGMGGVLLPRQQGRVSLQTFNGALGGARAAAITNSGDPERPFEVDGDTFVRRCGAFCWVGLAWVALSCLTRRDTLTCPDRMGASGWLSYRFGSS